MQRNSKQFCTSGIQNNTTHPNHYTCLIPITWSVWYPLQEVNRQDSALCWGERELQTLLSYPLRHSPLFLWNRTSVCVHLLQHSPEDDDDDDDMDKCGTVKRSGVLSPAPRHTIPLSTDTTSPIECTGNCDSTPPTVTPPFTDPTLADPSLFNCSSPSEGEASTHTQHILYTQKH